MFGWFVWGSGVGAVNERESDLTTRTSLEGLEGPGGSRGDQKKRVVPDTTDVEQVLRDVREP